MDDAARLVGSLIVAGFDGTSLPAKFAASLRAGELAGIILFSRNYESREQLRRLTQDVRIAAPTALIAVDQEGGRVVRFDGDFPAFPSPNHFAQKNDPGGFLNAVSVTSRALRADGVNLNLVPVCDLAPETTDHVMHSRSYSAEPGEVSEVVAGQIHRLHLGGVLSCAKHFPGLASATGDPHFVVSATQQPLAAFRERDWQPFRAAIGAGTDLIMTTHLRAPALDPANIATFSEKIVSGILRSELGFAGPIISDDLQMLGALEGINQVEAGARALRAGHDLILFANLHHDLTDVLQEIAARAATDEALAQHLQESYHRIGRWKAERASFFNI